MPDHLTRALENISNNDGVIGACVFDSDGIKRSTLPDEWATRDDLAQAAGELRMLRDAIDTTGMEAQTTIIEAGNGRAHFQTIAGGRLLMVLFYPQISCSIVDLSVKMAINELARSESIVLADSHVSNIDASGASGLSDASGASGVKVPKLLRKKIIDALAPHVGPIARVAYKDAKRIWSRDPAIAGDFDKLIMIVAGEISEPAAKAKFIEELRQALTALDV